MYEWHLWRKRGRVLGAGSVSRGGDVQPGDGCVFKPECVERNWLQRRHAVYDERSVHQRNLRRGASRMLGAGSMSCGGGVANGRGRLLESECVERNCLQRWHAVYDERSVHERNLRWHTSHLLGAGS